MLGRGVTELDDDCGVKFTDPMVESPGRSRRVSSLRLVFAAEPTERCSVGFLVGKDRDREILTEGVVGVRCGCDELVVCLDSIVFGGLCYVPASGGFSRHSVGPDSRGQTVTRRR